MPTAGRGKLAESQAQTMYQQGNYREAADAYRRLAQKNRPERARYQLLAAQAWREEGDYGQVRANLKEVQRNALAAEDALLLDLLYAELSLDNQDPQGALDLLVVDTGPLAPELAARFLELRARAFQASQNFPAAIRERAVLNKLLDPVERTANEHELRELLTKLDAEQRRTLLRETSREDPMFTWLLSGSAGSQARTPGGANSFLEMLGAGQISNTQMDLTELPRSSFSKVALLLPSEGPLAPAARAILDGVMAGYFADAAQRPNIQVYDSGISPESALAAYQLALSDGAERVLGPLQREQVTALFQAKEPLVPTLALNFAEMPVLPPRGSLQFALLPEEEAVAAAERMHQMGLKRVAVLVPDDDFGHRTADAFTVRFSALGGSVGERAFFPPQDTDQSSAISAALGLSQSKARAQKVRQIVGVPFTFQPSRRYDLDGIFLAARPAQARLLMPQLRAFDAEEWPVVSTSHLYAGAPGAGQDNDLNGVEFCDAPWILNSADASILKRATVSALPSSAGAGGRLFAFGLDAYRLLPYLEWIEANPGVGVPGATGKLSGDQNGNLRRQPAWARIANGVPQVIN